MLYGDGQSQRPRALSALSRAGAIASFLLAAMVLVSSIQLMHEGRESARLYQQFERQVQKSQSVIDPGGRTWDSSADVETTVPAAVPR